ncbi:Endoglucanase [compost metagenome]
MLAKDAAQRAELVARYAPMAALTARQGLPPEQVDALSGVATGHGPAGFSAALLPLLAASPEHVAGLAAQRQRVREQPVEAKAYYSQVLALFGQGWDAARYRFDPHGRLLPAWSAPCSE